MFEGIGARVVSLLEKDGFCWANDSGLRKEEDNDWIVNLV